jgi:hypothetical protein
MNPRAGAGGLILAGGRTPMLTRAMAVAAAMGLSVCGTALGKDSGHRVCPGVAAFQADSSRIGISIVLDDDRAGRPQDRIHCRSPPQARLSMAAAADGTTRAIAAYAAAAARFVICVLAALAIVGADVWFE